MFAPIEMWLIPDLFQYPGFSFMMPNVGPFSDILQTLNSANRTILQIMPLCTKTQLSYQHRLLSTESRSALCISVTCCVEQ